MPVFPGADLQRSERGQEADQAARQEDHRHAEPGVPTIRAQCKVQGDGQPDLSRERTQPFHSLLPYIPHGVWKATCGTEVQQHGSHLERRRTKKENKMSMLVMEDMELDER